MALIKCPECGKEISDRAKSCPSCGCPIHDNDSEKKKEILSKKRVKIKIPGFRDCSKFGNTFDKVTIKDKNGKIIWNGPSNSTASFNLSEEKELIFVVDKHLPYWPKSKIIICIILTLTLLGIFAVCGIGLATALKKNNYQDMEFMKSKVIPGTNYEVRIVSQSLWTDKHNQFVLSEVDNIDSDI